MYFVVQLWLGPQVVSGLGQYELQWLWDSVLMHRGIVWLQDCFLILTLAIKPLWYWACLRRVEGGSTDEFRVHRC